MNLHPATELWWEQRDKCRACAHHVRLTLNRRYGDDVGGERCKACPAERGKRDHLYCIDARLPEGPCGPNAKLFVTRPAPIVTYKTAKI